MVRKLKKSLKNNFDNKLIIGLALIFLALIVYGLGNISFTGKVIAKTQSTPITTCQTLNAMNTLYTLNQNVNSSGTCFTIGANNVTLDCAGYMVNYSQSSVGYGVNITGYNKTTISNCDILQFNTSVQGTAGIVINEGLNNSIINNTLQIISNFSLGAIYLNGSNNNITANNISVYGDYGVGIKFISDNNTFAYNSILINASGTTGIIDSPGSRNLIEWDNITIFGDSMAIKISNSDNNIIKHNLIEHHSLNKKMLFIQYSNFNIFSNNSFYYFGSKALFGLFFSSKKNNITSNIFTLYNNHSAAIKLAYSTKQNLFLNNVIYLRNSSSKGIYLGKQGASSDYDNTFIGNYIEINGGDSQGINLTEYSQNNTFKNTIINLTTGKGIFILADSGKTTGNNITNISFVSPYGKSRFFSEITIPPRTNVKNSYFNISYNIVFLNSSDGNVSFLNVPAEITLNNLSFTNPQIIADYNDDGMFDVCSAPTCNNLSYSGGTFVFNVTHFTSYKAQETSSISSCQTLNAMNTVYNLTQNVNSSGTCFTIGANNVTLDCAGYMVNYSQISIGYGVNISGYNKTTIKNCNIFEGSTQQNSYGIYLLNSLNSSIKYSNITTGGLDSSDIFGQSVSYSNFTSNILYMDHPQSYSSIYIESTGQYYSSYNKIYFSNITNGIELDGSGPGVYAGIGNEIIYNNILMNGTADVAIRTVWTNNGLIYGNNISNGALNVEATVNDTVMGNILNRSQEGTDGGGIRVRYNSGVSENNNIINNTIYSTAINSVGLSLSQTSGNNFIGNKIDLSAPGSTALHIYFYSRDNFFINNSLSSKGRYIYIGDYSENNIFTGGKFINNQGSLLFPGAIILENRTGGTAVNISELNISANKIYLQSANLQFLNTSAKITINNLSFTNPQIIADYNNDGMFDVCSAPTCNNLSYSGGTFVFNVSHFTSYKAQETPASTPISSGGGGGGSYRPPVIKVVNKTIPLNNSKKICKELWDCSEWNSCIGGVKTRNCNDKNSCGTFLDKPDETKGCAISQPAPKKKNYLAVILALIIVLLSIVIAIIYYYIVKNRLAIKNQLQEIIQRADKSLSVGDRKNALKEYVILKEFLTRHKGKLNKHNLHKMYKEGLRIYEGITRK